MKSAEDRDRLIQELQALWDQGDPLMRENPLKAIQKKLGIPATDDERQKTNLTYWHLCSRREIVGPSIFVTPDSHSQEFHIGSLVAVLPGCVIFCPSDHASQHGAECAFVEKESDGNFRFVLIPKRRHVDMGSDVSIVERGIGELTYLQIVRASEAGSCEGFNTNIQPSYWYSNLKRWLDHWLPF